MDEFMSNPVYLWATFGAVLIVFEAFTAPGLGLFLGGLGAFCTAIIIESGQIGYLDTALQFTCFFFFTIVWAAVLWKPLRKFRSGKGKNAQKYNDTIGSSAVVGERGIKRGETGQVLWSGTLMSAEIDDTATVDSLEAGAQVLVKSVSGTTFKIIPK